MEDYTDPGWRPAVRVAAGMVTGRGLSGSVLLVMRAAVLVLGLVAAVTSFGVLVLGAGSGEPQIDPFTARIGLSAAFGASVIASSMIGKGGPDTNDEATLSVSLFQITMRRVLAAAAVGPAGMILSWLSADATYVIFGSGIALLVMAVVSPTSDRMDQWQNDVAEAGSDLSVLEALGRPWR